MIERALMAAVLGLALVGAAQAERLGWKQIYNGNKMSNKEYMQSWQGESGQDPSAVARTMYGMSSDNPDLPRVAQAMQLFSQGLVDAGKTGQFVPMGSSLEGGKRYIVPDPSAVDAIFDLLAQQPPLAGAALASAVKQIVERSMSNSSNQAMLAGTPDREVLYVVGTVDGGSGGGSGSTASNPDPTVVGPNQDPPQLEPGEAPVTLLQLSSGAITGAAVPEPGPTEANILPEMGNVGNLTYAAFIDRYNQLQRSGDTGVDRGANGGAAAGAAGAQ